MTWTDYWCDLGLGGEQYYVGASVDIWADKNALKLSKEDLAKALSAKLKADPKFLLDKYLVHPPKPPAETVVRPARTHRRRSSRPTSGIRTSPRSRHC